MTWRTTRGRERYIRGVRAIAEVIGVNTSTVHAAIKAGHLRVFKTASIYYCRVDEVKRYMIARYKRQMGYSEATKIIRFLPIDSRERLIKLWLASDNYGIVGARLHHSQRHAFVVARPIAVELAADLYELTDLAYDIVHALLSNDVARRQRMGKSDYKYMARNSARSNRAHKKRRSTRYTLTPSQIRALEFMLHAPPLTGRNLLDLGVHRSTIGALKDRGFVVVLGDDDEGRTYAITEHGARALKGPN